MFKCLLNYIAVENAFTFKYSSVIIKIFNFYSIIISYSIEIILHRFSDHGKILISPWIKKRIRVSFGLPGSWKIPDFRQKDTLDIGMCFFVNTNSKLNFFKSLTSK